MLIEIDKSIKKLLQNEIEKYKEGNKKALSVILNLIKKDIVKLLNENELTIKLTKTIIEDTLGITIKDDTFYKWVRRNIKKGNTTGIREFSQPAPTPPAKPKPKKEVRDEKTAKVKSKKTINPKKIEEIMNNDNIFLQNEDYSKLL